MTWLNKVWIGNGFAPLYCILLETVTFRLFCVTSVLEDNGIFEVEQSWFVLSINHTRYAGGKY